MKPRKLSYGDRPQQRRKDIQIIAFAAINAGHPFGANEALILSVIRDVGLRCSEAELRRELGFLEDKGVIRLYRVDGAPWLARLVGPAIGISGDDANTAAKTVGASPDGTRPARAVKAARGDSRRSKRVSG